MTKVRIARKQLESSRRRGRGLGGALGLFVVICGALLLFLGTRWSCGGVDDARRNAAATKVLSALKESQKADRAMDSKNYGEAREHLKRIQEGLSGALNALEVERSP